MGGGGGGGSRGTRVLGEGGWGWGGVEWGEGREVAGEVCRERKGARVMGGGVVGVVMWCGWRGVVDVSAWVHYVVRVGGVVVGRH